MIASNSAGPLTGRPICSRTPEISPGTRPSSGVIHTTPGAGDRSRRRRAKAAAPGTSPSSRTTPKCQREGIVCWTCSSPASQSATTPASKRQPSQQPADLGPVRRVLQHGQHPQRDVALPLALDHRRVGDLDWQRHRERGARVLLAPRLDGALHGVHQALADREAETRAAVPARVRGIAGRERQEQPIHEVRRHPDPRVVYFDAYQRLA